MSEIDKAIGTIIAADAEPEALEQLLSSLNRKLAVMTAENIEMKASLDLIKKVNNGKCDTIDALCEREPPKKVSWGFSGLKR